MKRVIEAKCVGAKKTLNVQAPLTENNLEQERQELSLIGELMVELVMKGITAADIASILYEEFVSRLENNEDEEEFTESEQEEIVDSISKFQREFVWKE